MRTGKSRRRKGIGWSATCASGAVVVAVGLALALFWAGVRPLAATLLLGASLATFAFFAYDKWAAQNARLRVPERVLLGLALFGGTPGAALAMLMFRHKTRKRSFLVSLVLVFLVQLALIWLWRRAFP